MISISRLVSKLQKKLPCECKRLIGREGIPNIGFCKSLIAYPQFFIDFLKEVGLINSEILCENCNVPMIFTKDNGPDIYSWKCMNKSNKTVCGCTKTIKHGSWFKFSEMTLADIFILTYVLVRGYDTKLIENEIGFNLSTISNWRMFVTDVIFDYLELTSQKIGGVGKVVEIDVHKFENLRCNNDGRWVFGGIERETRKLVLVTVPDKAEETLINTIKNCIEPGTSVYSECWKTDQLKKEDFERLNVECKVSLIDSSSIHDTKAIVRTWGKVKNSVPTYDEHTDIKCYLTLYLFVKSCKEKGVDSFVKFLEIIRDIDWEKKQPNQNL